MDAQNVPVDALPLAVGGRTIPGGCAKAIDIGNRFRDTHPDWQAVPRSLLLVIAAAEILFQPDIQADEEVAAAHFLDGKFRISHAPVPPGNGNYRP